MNWSIFVTQLKQSPEGREGAGEGESTQHKTLLKRCNSLQTGQLKLPAVTGNRFDLTTAEAC